MRDPEERYFYTTPQALVAALQEVAQRKPDARLVKNDVGNISIMDTETHAWLGYVDLHEAEVVWIEVEVS